MTESEGGTKVNGSNEGADERGRPDSTGSNYLQVGLQTQARGLFSNDLKSLPHSLFCSKFCYLQSALGDVLADALSQVAKARPEDPIRYVANYLHSLR